MNTKFPKPISGWQTTDSKIHADERSAEAHQLRLNIRDKLDSFDVSYDADDDCWDDVVEWIASLVEDLK